MALNIQPPYIDWLNNIKSFCFSAIRKLQSWNIKSNTQPKTPDVKGIINSLKARYEMEEKKTDPLADFYRRAIEGYESDLSILQWLPAAPWTDRHKIQFAAPSEGITPYQRDSFATVSYTMTTTLRPLTLDDNKTQDEQAVMRAIGESMTRHTDNALIHPLLPASTLPTSNLATSSTKATMDINTLKEAMTRMPKDPLLEKGVARDWVCVVNYRTHAALEEYARKQPSMWGQSMSVDALVGRRTVIVPAAEDGLSYMPELEMYRRYAEYFVARARADLARIRREKLRAIRRAYGHKYAAEAKDK
jgi:hypothetical protein